MEIYFTGVIIAICTFLIIGLCHPLVIKFICAAFVVPNAFESEKTGIVVSSILGVCGASLLWGIGELFAQKKRVKKGWFPMNPKRKHEYEDMDENDSLCPVCKDNPSHPASYKEK